MTEKNLFVNFIDRLITDNYAFALWSVPKKNTPELLISEKYSVFSNSQYYKLNGEKGFVFAPYNITANSPVVLLKKSIYKKGIANIIKTKYPNFKTKHYNEIDGNSNILRQKDYLKTIKETINELKSTNLSKVIISRLIPFPRKNESLSEVYIQLLNQTPNAFVYMVNLPDIGMWMGATPEILLRSEKEMIETVSLAGTQLRKKDNDYLWRTKEIEEQAFVSRYLLDIFHKFNIHPYKTKGPVTLESGKVAHLATCFSFNKKLIENNLGEFIAELHPTPAVCGYPKKLAAQFITKIEKHNRKYYSGYLGPWRINNEVELFVNLRCMEVLKEKYILYSGGGITSRSIPEEEWEETNRKANTLLSVIKKIQSK